MSLLLLLATLFLLASGLSNPTGGYTKRIGEPHSRTGTPNSPKLLPVSQVRNNQSQVFASGNDSGPNDGPVWYCTHADSTLLSDDCEHAITKYWAFQTGSIITINPHNDLNVINGTCMATIENDNDGEGHIEYSAAYTLFKFPLISSCVEGEHTWGVYNTVSGLQLWLTKDPAQRQPPDSSDGDNGTKAPGGGSGFQNVSSFTDRLRPLSQESSRRSI